MLNKYFSYDNFIISLNRPELLLVQEFESLMDKDFNKSKEDPKGEYKLRAFKIFKYLFLMNDIESPYNEIDFDQKKKYALSDSGIDPKELLNDKFIKASLKYEVLTKTRLMKMLESAQTAVDKFTLYFHTVDYTKIDDVTGKPVFAIKDGIASVSMLGKLVEGLKLLQEQVRKEMEADTGLRGGTEAGFLD